MNKKVLVSLASHRIGMEDENIEILTPAQFYKKGQCYYIVYEETELSGMEGTKTTLKIAPNKFTLIRFGNTTTSMDFKKDEESVVLYNTPYGALELKIETKKLNIDMSEFGGEVSVNYNMSILGEMPQDTFLKINVMPQEI